MSAIIKTKRRKSLPASTAALWLVLGLAVTFFLVRYGQELLLAHDLNEKAAAQRTANAALRDENSRLKALLQYNQSDKYIEQRAREDLNLRRPEEEVLIPVAATLGATGQSATPSIKSPAQPGNAAPTPAPEQANWQNWLDLFSPAP